MIKNRIFWNGYTDFPKFQVVMSDIRGVKSGWLISLEFNYPLLVYVCHHIAAGACCHMTGGTLLIGWQPPGMTRIAIKYSK